MATETDREKILATLCKMSPLSIEIIDIEHKMLKCSSGWSSDHFGYTKEKFQELSQNLFEKIVHPDDRETQLNAYNSLFKNHDLPFKECQIRVLKSDGEYTHIQLRLTILECDDQNNPTKVLSTVMDIDELTGLRARLQRELKKLEIISFKNSHELRAPVSAILGLIQLIEHDQFEGSHAFPIISSLKKTVVKLDEVIKEINKQAN